MHAAPALSVEPTLAARSERPRRSFGVGFVANRVLVGVLLLCTLAAVFAMADRMLAAGWSSQLDVALAVTAALATGALFQANYPRVIRFVDRLFLPRRYAASVALDWIASSLRARNAETSDRVADDIAQALGLRSVAIFTRTGDDGFVRRAAFGWPGGTVWHLLPGESLTLALHGRDRVVALTDADAADVALPQGLARPCIAVTARRRNRVYSAILLGTDRQGGVPDTDTVRGLAAVVGEAWAG